MSTEEMKVLADATIKRREQMRDYSRKYRKEHPDRVLQSKIRTAISLLTSEGYVVTKSGDVND